MCQRVRLHLPTTQGKLRPKFVDPERMTEKLEEKQVRQKRYYDRGSRKLPTVQKGESVRVQVQNKVETSSY